MSNYISTNYVLVFPSALRTARAEGKFTSESNLTGIVRTITGKDSFYRVIRNGSEITGYILVIYGYCFQVDGALPENAHYAHIRLEDSGRLVSEGGDTSLDEGGFFKGLFFTSEAITPSDNIKTLPLTPENELYVDATSIYGVLPATHGGTGVSDLTQLTAGKATNADISCSTEGDVDTIQIGSGTSYKVTNAENATKLKTAITINGSILQEGGKEITTNKWGAKRIIAIHSGDSTSFNNDIDGSGNIDLYLPMLLSATLNGNASSATQAGKLTTNAGSSSKPVYFSGGIPVLCGTIDNATNATRATYLGSKAVGASNQLVYLDSSGAPQAGIRITAAGSAPSGASVGDIWIRI